MADAIRVAAIEEHDATGIPHNLPAADVFHEHAGSHEHQMMRSGELLGAARRGRRGALDVVHREEGALIERVRAKAHV